MMKLDLKHCFPGNVVHFNRIVLVAVGVVAQLYQGFQGNLKFLVVGHLTPSSSRRCFQYLPRRTSTAFDSRQECSSRHIWPDHSEGMSQLRTLLCLLHKNCT